MTAKNLTTVLSSLNGQSSRDDEIEALRTIESMIDCNTYLAGLFTKDLLGWVEGQIRSDFPANIYDAWTYEKKEAASAREAWTRDANIWTESVNRLNAELDLSRETKDKLEEANADLKERLLKKDDRIAELIERKDRAEEQVQLIARETEEQIIRLKAMIFDLEHPTSR